MVFISKNLSLRNSNERFDHMVLFFSSLSLLLVGESRDYLPDENYAIKGKPRFIGLTTTCCKFELSHTNEIREKHTLQGIEISNLRCLDKSISA